MSKRILSDAERADYRDAKRSEQRALIEASCREMLSSEGWRRFAETRAAFHRYSFGNCALIAYQRPDATQVAGFKSWQALGRQVRKGERSIRILAPMSVKERDEQGNETDERLTFFRAVPVFDISQTDGDALPEAPREPITGDSHAGYVERLEQYARSLGYTVEREALDAAGGYCDHKRQRIVVSSNVDSANAHVRVLVHELAHALGVGYAEYGREVAEVIVETATVIVCGSVGLDTSGESIPYITGWGEQDLDAIRRHAAKVDEIARALETVCEVS